MSTKKMESIHFEHLSWNWQRILLLSIAAVCMLVGFGIIPGYENNLITSFGFLILIVLLSKRFWYKNYVEYNKLGIVIKINLVLHKTLKFGEINHIVIKDQTLKVSLSTNKEVKFKLRSIKEADKDQLIRLLVENSNSKLIDHRI